MPKFYVTSGRVKRVVDRADALSAAHAVIRQHAYGEEGQVKETETIGQLGLLTSVSEQGFHGKDRQAYATHSIMMCEGPFERFRREEL